jgi:hypothetical protein
MIQIFDCEQGSPEWYACRLGIPTASEFDCILAQGRSGGPSKTRRTYMMKLVGEILTGEAAYNYTNDHMERGKEMEAEARDLYTFKTDIEPQQVGFIRNGSVGCSPDSLVGDKGLLEIKTKLAHLQLEVLLDDVLPPEHKAQVQGQLWVAEREFVDFVCYWPRLPLFAKRVYRDEEYIKNLARAVDQFRNEMAQVIARVRPVEAAA